MARHNILGLILVGALLVATVTADSLSRLECFCEGSGISGYWYEYQYESNRLGITITAQNSCAAPIGNPPKCNADIALLVDICGTKDSHEFCYDHDVWSSDDYSLDGHKKRLHLHTAQEIGGLDEHCSIRCSLLDPGLTTECVGHKCMGQDFFDLKEL